MQIYVPKNSCRPLQHILIFGANQIEIEGFSIARACLKVSLFVVYDPEIDVELTYIIRYD